MNSVTDEGRPGVSVVIPSYNGLELLKKQLPIILDQLEYGDELIVVDDQSNDQTQDWFSKFEAEKKAQGSKIDLKLIYNPSNLRFVGSVNKGFASAKHGFVLLLNNDVFPRVGMLDALFATWNEFSKEGPIFAISCKEFEELDSGEIVVSGKNKLWFERGMFIHSRSADLTTGPTAWASGGSALFDRRKWQDMGGMDPNFYPAYWEDIDISVRARIDDWQVLFCTRAEVDHRHETTNKSVFGPTIGLYSWKNAFYFAWKHMNLRQWLSHLLWLPYHLVVSGWKTGGLTLRAFLLALGTVMGIRRMEK